MSAPATAPTAPPINAPSTSPDTAPPTAAPPSPPMTAPFSIWLHPERTAIAAMAKMRFLIGFLLQLKITVNQLGVDSFPELATTARAAGQTDNRPLRNRCGG